MYKKLKEIRNVAFIVDALEIKSNRTKQCNKHEAEL